MGSKGRDRNLRQFGLLGGFPGGEDDEDEGNLEKELNSLLGEAGGRSKRGNKGKAKKPTVSPEEFNAMVSACLADDTGDANDESDLDDDALLDELNDIISDDEMQSEEEKPRPVVPPPSSSSDVYASSNLLAIVEGRISMYSSAKDAAAAAGDSSHARRYGRALDQLKDSLRRIKTGKPVNEDDLPPPLSGKQIATQDKKVEVPSLNPSQDMEPSPLPADSARTNDMGASPSPLPANLARTNDIGRLDVLRAKRESFKKEALAAKARGDKEAAIEGLRGVKAMDELISKYETKSAPAPSPASNSGFDRDKPIVLPSNIEEIPSAEPSVFGAPPPPKSVIEALTQRLEYYEKEEIRAKNDENASKARRIGRICKQYKDAIKATKGGKTIDVESLPSPLGYAPIPVPSTPAKSTAVKENPTPPPAASGSTLPSKPSQGSYSVQEKQLRTLLQRQALFKSAALEAKKAGQMSQAKEYLRQYHGFDNLIEASRGGLPVDLNSTPVPPQLEGDNEGDASMDFVIISRQDSLDEGKSRQEMFSKLEEELLAQVKMCESNRAYFKSTGDIASSNKFHQMEVHTKKDLTALRHAYKRNAPVPIFHYEVRSFSKVICNTDLTDNEVELSIIAGNGLKGDKSIDTYVCYEFPYPKEDPFKGETGKVKDSTSPEYEHKVSIPINIKEKSCQRIFKRHSVKCDVWIDRGFFRKDVLLGTVSAKLAPLETHCTLHECFPLMEGRKAVGGTLEIKVRLRNPVLTKQVEKAQEKWLVISF